MPSKQKKILSESLKQLSLGKTLAIGDENDLTKAALEHKSNTFTPYKLHLLS
jgi:hypothetical protein